MCKFMENFFNTDDLLTTEVREKMLKKEHKFTYESINELYKDWKFGKSETLEHDFYELSDFNTTMRTLKVRGVYDTQKEASVRAQVLRKKDPSFNVFVGQVGYWLPWDPEPNAVQEQEYQEGMLNDLVKKYNENLDNRDDMFEQEKKDKIERARKEVQAKKDALKEKDQGLPEKPTTDEQDKQNIDSLRTMVDDADKAFYENKKKVEQSTTPPSATGMESLEAPDPWLARKNDVV
ncbi:MAG: hypothetical protein EBS37_17375 [Betaproteobacteria bacterium]|nr:hypothetical protein [Betaproteobacteria bacterium]